MKLSTRARYALRMMLDIARNGGEDTPVSLAAVAGRTGISRGYLEQLALALRQGNLVRGVAGRHGGYRLLRTPEETSIGAIIEATIGPVCIVDCVTEPEACPRADSCECRIVYGLINRQVQEVLQDYTLDDLLDPSWVREHLPLADGEHGAPGEAPGRHRRRLRKARKKKATPVARS